MWGATSQSSEAPHHPHRFQSTRPVWGATCIVHCFIYILPISIHAPRVGRDDISNNVTYYSNISIHAPRVGRDACSAWTLHEQAIFQSTRPVWGATGPTSPRPPLSRFQSTRPVWGATPHRITPEDWAKDFNPRAPCGARRRWNGSMGKRDHFNPRAPCGARRSGRSAMRP